MGRGLKKREVKKKWQGGNRLSSAIRSLIECHNACLLSMQCSGTCANCLCQKGGRRCQDCLPMRINRCRNTSDQLLDDARQFTPDSGLSQLISVCDRGETTSKPRVEPRQDVDETEPGNSDATLLDAEDTALPDTDSDLNQLGGRDGVSDNSMGIGGGTTLTCVSLRSFLPALPVRPILDGGKRWGHHSTSRQSI